MLLSLDHAVFGTMFICGTFGFFAGLFRSLLDLAAIVVVGVAASLLPTWRAATVNVVEGFRHLG